jgi:4-aminobutyrate aminotransferase-like enzyme/Ser/Thr protein kinase RdoA (MazF antagonist)/murein DD-endopeptidase MepM/ murein hydrolase activator NlpD
MPSLADAPRLSLDAAARLASDLFGVVGMPTSLPSERDQNVCLTGSGGTRFVLKIANAGEDRAMLEAENLVMQHLASTGIVPLPLKALKTTTGETIASADGHFVRLITWVDGKPLGDTARHTDALLEDLGRAVGTLDRALAGFDHPALRRDFYWDLSGAPARIRHALPRVSDPALDTIISRFLDLHRTDVEPRVNRLPKTVIHGDVNDFNVLVDPHASRVTGIVDFGDMVFSETVNDLAIAMAYAALGKVDPIGAACLVARGYHASRPLSEDEVAVLFALMATRLCLSVTVAAAQQAERPDNNYLGISQAPIRETLPKLAAVHPRLAHYRLRGACGLPPVPHAPRVVEYLRSRAGQFAGVTAFDLTKDSVGIDLSVGSTLVASNPADNAPEPFGGRLFDVINRAGASVGVGGYDEARVIYAADAFAGGAVTDERRTVHLGVDLTLPAGSPVHAPLDGVVHGFEDANVRLDYGPVVVLRHEVPGDEPLAFFTLYGHLSRRSLEGLVIGKRVRAGQRFAEIGAPAENGNWWPHLHFQVITDLLDVPCNFNGVAPASQRATWLSLSPDPNLILNVPPARLPRRRSQQELLSLRQRHFGDNVKLSYGDHPLRIERGWMQYLFDETGRTYIDAYNNVPHVGHSHPRVTEAVTSQLATLNTNTRYLNEVVLEYAQELTARFQAPLEVCFFTASGSEANELALRLARAATGHRDLIVMDEAYHGHTTTLIDISPYKHKGPGGEGAPAWVHASPIPDVFRGRHRADDDHAGLKYAADVGRVIDRIRTSGRNLCGYFAETCPSVGGQIMLPPEFLAETYRLVRDAGGVCIADEVQTGFGRLGTHFWAFEAHGVVPDIVVLGKPIANGYPLGAVITTRAIADRFANGMEFFSTFGGSTAACAAGLATLRAVDEGGLLAHARDVGAHLLSELRRLQSTHDLIGDVRGSGLFIGVELVRDRRTLEPAGEEAAAIVNRMRELGVLAGTDGPFHNVIKIRGPMSLTTRDADLVVAALATALRERHTQR